MTNSHTYYSLRYGTIAPKALLQLASDMGYDCFAITDINNTSSALDFVRLAPKYNIRPVIGIDFRNGAQQKYVGLARNNTGFQWLNAHLSNHMHESIPFEDKAPEMSEVFIIYPFATTPHRKLAPHEFIGVKPSDLSRLRFSPWRHQPEKLVAMPTFTFRHQKDFNAHRLLRAIDNNTLLSKLPLSEQGNRQDMLMSRDELFECYTNFPQLIENAFQLMEGCHVQFEFGTDKPHKNLQTFTGNTQEDFQLLRQLCRKGLNYRYPQVTQKILERLEKELKIIREKGFISYFLINWDITRYARSKDYFYVGRGSGANSIVAYLLRITDVDPIELDLYFERFINLYRQNPPDFDIDFSWMDRDDVTDYIFNRFPNVALLAAYSTFQYRAVVRELGKVFGLPKHEIDLLSSGRFNMYQLDELSQLVLKYSSLIQGFPNHLTVHAAGILISEKPMHYYTATFMPPKGYPTTHFDMVVAEDVGLNKFDILSQRGLGKIKDTLGIIRYNQPEAERFNIHNIGRFKEDEKIKDLLRNAKAIGCFYVESPAMRMLLKKLQVDDYLGLVAASSVIRPGVAQSGMMRQYILRHRYPEKRKEAHPVMLDIMPETYGVMVYQEDVIKVAHYFAGLTLGEADVLRRGMSGKFRSREEFEKVKEKFYSNCIEKGYTEELTNEIWRQTESFAGYAFAKGHSASYAVESYQSLFLKAYYPLEYMVATINNHGGFYRTELYVHEARMHGATIVPPCINLSSAATQIQGKTIFLGMGMVKELEHKTIEAVLEERTKNGDFSSLNEFVKRVAISIDQICLLIRIGAFRFTGISKKEMLWKAHLLLGHNPKPKFTRLLFEAPTKDYALPKLYTAPYEDAFDEIELLGFPLCDPFGLLREDPPVEILANDLSQYIGKKATIVGYLITVKNTKTNNGKSMYFGTFVDREGYFMDTVHFPPVAEKFPFRGKGIYQVTGKVTEEFGCINLEAQHMMKLPIIEDPRYSDANTVTRIQKTNSWMEGVGIKRREINPKEKMI